MEVSRITGTIGALVEGVDVRKVDDREIDRFRSALHEHHVLFLREQDLTDDEHLEFARRFGAIEIRTPHGKTSEFQYIEDTESNPPHTDQWHTDHSCLADPPLIAFLWSATIPAFGGDTIWTSLCAAYDALSPTMQAVAEQLTVRHSIAGDYWDSVSSYYRQEGVAEAEITRRYEDAYRRSTSIHPLVISHPVTGRKALYLSPRFTERIEGLHPAESRALLCYLESLLDNANHQVRWHWQEHDLAIWDERATNHRALADHFSLGPQHRMMRRCTVAGGEPAAAGALL
jgi:taurine dioxygenase